MKKRVRLAAAMLMLLAVFASCNKPAAPPADSEPQQTEAETSPYLDHLPADLDFNQEEVNIFYGVYDPNFDCKALEVEGNNDGDFVAEKVYKRNEEVQNRLNVFFDFTQVETSSDAATYAAAIEQNVIHAQSTEYDLVYHRAANAAVHSNMGYFRSVNDLPYVDWDMSYWFYNQMEAVSLNSSRIYMILGDLLISNYSNISTMFFNMDLYETLFPGQSASDLYDMVKNNEWTWENYFAIVADAYQDNDGIDGATAGDTYGANWENGTRTCQYYPYTSGLRFTERDQDGFPSFTLNNDRTVSMVEDLYDFIHQNPGTYMMTYDEAQNKFLNGTMLFYSYFLSLGKVISQNAEFEYGILPFPKYDELTDYTSVLLTGAGVYVIPYTIQDEERLSRIGATLEALCASGSRLVVPEYYETVVKIKESGTEQNKEMIEFIRDHLQFDLSFWMSNSLGKVASTFQQCIIKDQSNNYSSTWQKYGATYEGALKSLIEQYSGKLE